MNRFCIDVNDYLDENRIEDLAEISSEFSPEFVKMAEIPLTEDLEKLPNDAFALILIDNGKILRKYACNSPEMTILNTELLSKTAKNLPEEIVKTAAYYLSKMCYDFKYEEGFKKLAGLAYKEKPSRTVEVEKINKVSYAVKQDSIVTEKNAWALPDKKKYPLTTEEEVNQAIEYFDVYGDQLKQAEKLAYAINTAGAARNFKISIDPDRHKVASYASLNMNKLANDVELHIGLRQKLTNEQYAELYGELKEKTAEYDTNPLAFADILTKLDTQAGLAHHWGGLVDDPIYCCLDKIKTSSVTIDGRNISMSNIQTIVEHEKVGDYLDHYTLKELQSLDGLEVFTSLPYPVREELYKLL